MESPTLTGQEKAALRSRGQLLEPLLTVGREGASAAVVAQLDRILAGRDLVKVRLPAGRQGREALIEELARATGSAVAGSVGRTVLFWRPPPDRA